MPQAGGGLFKKGFRAAGPEARAVTFKCDAPAGGMAYFYSPGGQLGRTPMTEGIVAPATQHRIITQVHNRPVWRQTYGILAPVMVSLLPGLLLHAKHFAPVQIGEGARMRKIGRLECGSRCRNRTHRSIVMSIY